MLGQRHATERPMINRKMNKAQSDVIKKKLRLAAAPKSVEITISFFRPR